SPVHGASQEAEAGRQALKQGFSPHASRPPTRPEGRAYAQSSTSHETNASAPLAVSRAARRCANGDSSPRYRGSPIPMQRHDPTPARLLNSQPAGLLNLAPSCTTGALPPHAVVLTQPRSRGFSRG